MNRPCSCRRVERLQALGQANLFLFTKEDEIKMYVQKIQRAHRKYRNDPEAAHGRAEDIVCELLEKLGYGKVVKAFLNRPGYNT